MESKKASFRKHNFKESKLLCIKSYKNLQAGYLYTRGSGYSFYDEQAIEIEETKDLVPESMFNKIFSKQHVYGIFHKRDYLHSPEGRLMKAIFGEAEVKKHLNEFTE